MPRQFNPSEFGNRLECFAWQALEAGDVESAKWAEDEFYREGTDSTGY
jgi:hypothetical protein